MARPRLHVVNEYFFDKIDTEQKAYWLGFLYADGHPAERALMLALAAKDAEHVEKFKIAIGFAHQVRHSDRVSAISVSSKRLSGRVRELREQCFIPKKKTNHFVRGVFDGDGCISLSARGFFSATIAASKQLAASIQTLAEERGISGSYIYKHSKPNTPTYILHFTTLDNLCAFRDWIYTDATIFLERKKMLFDSASPLMDRACVGCGKLFHPRYADKGSYCSRKCYMRDYYAGNRETKWKRNGEWA